MTYEPLKNFENDYEICNEYPYTIRRITDGFIPKTHLDSKGYIIIALNCNSYKVHRLIAKQFIPNPNNLQYIDHINHIRTDNHIENLRWCSSSTNNRNRSSYNDGRGSRFNVDYISYDDAPDDIIYITCYGTHEIDGYAYSFNEDTFYYDTKETYRILPIRTHHNKTYVYVRDIHNKPFELRINKFKRDINII